MNTKSSSKRGSAEMNEANEKQKSFLLEEIRAIEKVLQSLKGTEADSLREETRDKKNRLEKDVLSFFLLSSSGKEIGKLKEKVESLATKQNFLTRIPTPVWIAIISLPVVIYIAWLAILQSKYQPEIRKFAMETAILQTASAVSTPNTQTAMPSGTETPTPALPTATP